MYHVTAGGYVISLNICFVFLFSADDVILSCPGLCASIFVHRYLPACCVCGCVCGCGLIFEEIVPR